MAAAAALAWGGRAVPLWMQKLYRWGGATSRTNPFRGPRATKPGSFKPVDRRFGPVKPEMGPPRPMMDKGGLFFRNPKKTFWGAAAGGPIAAGVGYGLLDDDEPSTDIPGKPYVPTPEPKEVVESTVPGQREAFLNKRRKRLKKGMKQILNQYMILSYVSPDEAGNFLKAAMEMMEADQDFNDDIYMQDAYDAVFQEGNMPTTGREAFKLLSPLIGHESAMEIAGEYADLAPDYKEHQYMTKQRMEMRDVVALDNAGDRPGAIAMLIRGWQSGSFKTRPDHLVIGQSSKEDWIKAANEAIDLMTTGSATAGTGGANWALPSSNEIS